MYTSVPARQCTSEFFSHHCYINDISFVDFWTAFDEAWPRVKYPKRVSDTFADAVRLARIRPIRLPANLKPLTEAHAEVASIAYYLAQYTNGNPFLLPVRRLYEVLGVDWHVTVSRILKWLSKHDLIRCVDHRHSRKFGIGKKYILGSVLTKRNQDTPRDQKTLDLRDSVSG